jgi:hypothetical protein
MSNAENSSYRSTTDLSSAPDGEQWLSLPYEAWQDTYATLHMWTQIVGKIRLMLSPPVNHWWHTTLYVTARGLTTSVIPYGNGVRTFEITFDFLQHNLCIQLCDTRSGLSVTKYMSLYPRSVADFYRELISMLRAAGVEVSLFTKPQEVPDPILFEQDTFHDAYDPVYANRWWRILAWSDNVFKEFRGRFLGKCSPVHFWWGSFDLAVTRFSGRRAPDRPGADHITREAYSHECSSAGFWPGQANSPMAAFYSYMAPASPGIELTSSLPQGAYYDDLLGEFLLPLDVLRTIEQPRQHLLDFLQTTYVAGADLAQWNREALERNDWEGQ